MGVHRRCAPGASIHLYTRALAFSAPGAAVADGGRATRPDYVQRYAPDVCRVHPLVSTPILHQPATVSMPTFGGIEAAPRIRRVASKARIVLSQPAQTRSEEHT